jgi:hypothetical protein
VVFKTKKRVGHPPPIQMMASYDREPDKATALKQSGAIIVVALAFIVFQFVPQLMMPWSWLVRFLLHRYA